MHEAIDIKLSTLQRRKYRFGITVEGAVQGVGFRPFIYRLAKETGVSGFVRNTNQGVYIEAEGDYMLLRKFVSKIETEKPPLASIRKMKIVECDSLDSSGFNILQSKNSGDKTAMILPDIAVCEDCIGEIFDPSNRRYLYPFTNCTNCGPRYSIIESLPYDRQNTSMKKFGMCKRCSEEYENPSDRRFHAQPNACPDCGPHLELWDIDGKVSSHHHEAMLETVQRIRDGKIAAVKGIGGFHLIVDAKNEDAVNTLRKRKGRLEKPFALMFPTIESVRMLCEVSDFEMNLLLSPESPIVLLKRNSSDDLAPSVAPGNPYFGVMLPYSPLHHILMDLLAFPVIATSGNLSDEPLCSDENEASDQLKGMTDFFLIHNRPIINQVDDSIVREIMGREMLLRRARGYAPLPFSHAGVKKRVLAVGGHLKNAVGLSKDNNTFISQHIGNLDSKQSYKSFRKTIDNLRRIYEIKPDIITCDKHPDYLSTQYASVSGLPVIHVQHHYAHIMSCMSEHNLDQPALGVCWDGTGYGDDGTIWGGEFLLIDGKGYKRVAHFRTFPLPGGEAAVKEPRRSALGLLSEIFKDNFTDIREISTMKAFTEIELRTIMRAIRQKLNSPLTSSAGRLFDAVSSIMGIQQVNDFEGQAAMKIEFLAENNDTDENYSFDLTKTESAVIIDWEPMILQIISDLVNKVSKADISSRFHNTLVEIIIRTVQLYKQDKIVLTGGCFQNKYLLEKAVNKLQNAGFHPYWHRLIPPNDGGLALGQAAAVSMTGED